MVLKRVSLYIFSLLFCIELFSQNKLDAFVCDSIFIYNEYDQVGNTSALKYDHIMLDSNEHKKSKLSNDDLLIVQDFISSNKNRKLFQMKYGGELYYLQIYSAGNPYRFVAYGDNRSFSLHNLDEMRYFETHKSLTATKLTEIIKKYWR